MYLNCHKGQIEIHDDLSRKKTYKQIALEWKCVIVKFQKFF